VPCDYCGKPFDPIATRWLCPHCHMKANCCDGAPLAERVCDLPPAGRA
jgi:Zn finger protein HypA/HybF involved in hydrogenase expression